jgi:hypothetical protein
MGEVCPAKDAVMQTEGIERILSFGCAFEGIPGVQRIGE